MIRNLSLVKLIMKVRCFIAHKISIIIPRRVLTSRAMIVVMENSVCSLACDISQLMHNAAGFELTPVTHIGACIIGEGAKIYESLRIDIWEVLVVLEQSDRQLSCTGFGVEGRLADYL